MSNRGACAPLKNKINMLYKEFRGFNPDVDIAAVEQGRALPLSEVIETGIVPAVVSEGEFVELDTTKGLSRPEDVFDSIEMSKSFRSSVKAKVEAEATNDNQSATRNG